MRTLAIPLLLAGAAWAAPKKAPTCVKTSEEAVEIARTRGKLIFLTVIIDSDAENRMVIDALFRDKAFLKIAEEFVVLYANKDDEHGRVQVKTDGGKREPRCADCPSITCQDHMIMAMNFARGFFPTSEARTPVHFVIDHKLDVLEVIGNGSFEQGFSHVPAKEVVAKLKKVLDKHGRGLTEEQYTQLTKHLADARAARARNLVTAELEHLSKVVALGHDVEGVRTARARVAEIDKLAARELEKVGALVEGKQWEEALDLLARIRTTYPGTPTGEAAAQRDTELQSDRDVKRLLEARDLYEAGLKFKENGRIEIALKRFEKCVRRGAGTKYADLAASEIKQLSSDR